MKKAIATALAMILAMGLVACGTVPSDSSVNNDASTSAATESQQSIEVEKELFDVKVTLPADVVGEITQEELDAESDHFHSATLNEDGSVTFVMSKSQHKELLKELAASIQDELDKMPGSEQLPNVTKVEANKGFTVFTVTTSSQELSIQESFSVLNFYVYGGMYGLFSQEDVDNIHVDFVNAATGEIIESADSSSLDDN